jgi:hypothetical protein
MLGNSAKNKLVDGCVVSWMPEHTSQAGPVVILSSNIPKYRNQRVLVLRLSKMDDLAKPF